jgi:hypothetical protein
VVSAKVVIGNPAGLGSPKLACGERVVRMVECFHSAAESALTAEVAQGQT